jgi:hypothetical protein
MGEFTPEQQRAIALTLLDLEGWGTLSGDLVAFDPMTGAPIDPPRREVGEYDRPPRRGLPDDWAALFIERGWLDLVRIAGPRWVWKPTRAGVTVCEAWLPDHLKYNGGR